MKATFLAIILYIIFIACIQSCPGPSPLGVDHVTTTNTKLSFVISTVSPNQVTATWVNPTINQNALISVAGWTSENGTLIEAILQGPTSQINSSVGNRQTGVLYSTFDAGTVTIFQYAQIDKSNSNFEILMTALTNSASTSFAISLNTGTYNQLNGSCISSCTTSIQFYVASNGVQNKNIYSCFDKKIGLGLFILLLTLLIV